MPRERERVDADYRCPSCGDPQPVRVLAAEHCSPERPARIAARIERLTRPKEQ